MDIKIRYVMQNVKNGNIILEEFTIEQLEKNTLTELSPIHALGHDLIGRDQFTGKLDGNHKEIYNNDIVEVTYSDSGEIIKEIITVGHSNNGLGFSPMNWAWSCDGCDLNLDIISVFVIGNIHTHQNKQSI